MTEREPCPAFDAEGEALHGHRVDLEEEGVEARLHSLFVHGIGLAGGEASAFGTLAFPGSCRIVQGEGSQNACARQGPAEEACCLHGVLLCRLGLGAVCRAGLAIAVISAGRGSVLGAGGAGAGISVLSGIVAFAEAAVVQAGEA